jgi:cation diffusion facilitator CzcD-associated flavoprotein CzcO
LIIGAGPAGLATAAELSRRGVAYRLVERGPTLGHSWENAYDSLTLHTGRHLSALPGRGFARGTPLFPSKRDFLSYLADYARAFDLRVETGVDVGTIGREDDEWVARANGSELRGPAVVMATGIMAKPRLPEIPGRDAYTGTVIHSVEYRRPGALVGKRVLVIGVGNSGGEIGSELAHAGARVTVAVRTGANVVPREIAGIPIQYLVYAMRPLPRRAKEWVAARVRSMSEKRRGPPVLPRPPWSPLDAVPLIGFHLPDAIRAGLIDVKLGGVAAFEPGGVRFDDGTSAPFDAVILATGFEPALDALGGLVRRDAHGFALRTDRVTSADQPGLWFVGHNYDSTGGLANIARDAKIVGARLGARH